MDPSPIVPDPELLLCHAGFVRSLARALLTRERPADDSVDDVVQQTWLAALTRPPRDPGALRSWLARVVRSRVRETRRGDERRERREREVAPSEIVADADPARAAERLAVLRDVVDAVLALEAPARAVIVARYLEERTPTEISARERVPVATIETRLRRAREQLRKRLDARYGGDRKAFLAALAGLAHGGHSAATISGPVATAAWAGVAATVAFVAWMGWIAWSSGAAALRNDSAAGEIAKAAGAETNGGDLAPVRAVDVGPEAGAASGASVRLRVVAKESGRPLAGATVHFVDAPADPRERVRDAWLEEARARDRLYDEHHFLDGDWYLERQRELEAKATRPGHAFTCDRNGEVVLPPFSIALFAARSGAFATAGWIERGEKQPLLFEVEREVGLRIAVVDRSGRPQPDVPVMLQRTMNQGSDSQGRKLPWGMAIWRGKTHGTTSGPIGIAEVSGAEMRELLHEVGPQNRMTHSIALGLPGADAGSVPIDLGDLPTEPARLTLPPTGRMRVRLTTPDGAALLEPALVGIGPLRHHPILQSRNVMRLWQRAERGSVEIDRIGLNNDFSIFLAVENDERRPTITDVVGPTHEDETAEVVVAAGPPVAVVTGRLLAPDGEPIRDWPLRAKYDITLNRHERIVETDEEGSFRLPLAQFFWEYQNGPGTETTRELTLAPFHATELDPALGNLSIVHKFTNEELEPGLHDLGDLQSGEASLIVAGRVVDPDHRPCADVDLDVEQERDAGFMRNVDGIHGRTKRDGTFSIAGAPTPRRLRLLARGDDCFLAQPLEFASGAKNLEVVVEHAGELRGTLLVDSGVRLDDVTLDVSDEFITYGSWARDPSENVSIAADGRFRVARMHAGRGALTVALGLRYSGHRDLEPVVKIADLTVAAGAVCDDSRVQTIDLRGKLRPLDFTVHDDAGRPLAQANVRLLVEPSDETHSTSRTAMTGPDGVAHLLGFAATYRVTIDKEGYETTTLTGVPSSREVVLKAKQ